MRDRMKNETYLKGKAKVGIVCGSGEAIYD